MKIRTLIVIAFTHATVGIFGFAAGIYALPILTAPTSPSIEDVANSAKHSLYQTSFQRELKGSDFLHWGEGKVSLSTDVISFQGELSPGPDFKLYLSPVFVETEAEFEQFKSQMVSVGDIKTFNNFMVNLSSDIAVSNYTTVIVWCESFGEFITSAQYQ